MTPERERLREALDAARAIILGRSDGRPAVLLSNDDHEAIIDAVLASEPHHSIAARLVASLRSPAPSPAGGEGVRGWAERLVFGDDGESPPDLADAGDLARRLAAIGPPPVDLDLLREVAEAVRDACARAARDEGPRVGASLAAATVPVASIIATVLAARKAAR